MIPDSAFNSVSVVWRAEGVVKFYFIFTLFSHWHCCGILKLLETASHAFWRGMDPFAGRVQLCSSFQPISQTLGIVIGLKPTGFPIYALSFFLASYKGSAFAKTVSMAEEGWCYLLISSSSVSAAPSKCTTSFEAQHVLQSASNTCLLANERAGKEPNVKDPGCTLLLGSILVGSILTWELLPRPGASPDCLVPLCGLASCAMIDEFLLFLV